MNISISVSQFNDLVRDFDTISSVRITKHDIVDSMFSISDMYCNDVIALLHTMIYTALCNYHGTHDDNIILDDYYFFSVRV